MLATHSPENGGLTLSEQKGYNAPIEHPAPTAFVEVRDVHNFLQELAQYHSDKAHHLLELEACVANLIENDYPKNAQRLLQQLFQPFLLEAESIHHKNEELILSHLRTTAAPIHRRVEEISADHAALDRIVTNIATEIDNQPMHYRDVCTSIVHFIKTYDDHATGEESIFFPIAEQFLERQHWLAISKAWTRQRLA